MDYAQRLKEDQLLIENALRQLFQGQERFGDLYEAMEYSLLAGGKRLRPVLVLECCRLCGGDVDAAVPLACAVEMVHTYSLIHDDLPAMDNDDLRRGKPTNHKVFGEATAILAGDGLLTAAFQVIAQAPQLSENQRLRAVYALSAAAGPAGMVGGQILDMAGEGHDLTREQVEQLQRLKTGALIRCAAHLGCIAANAPRETAQAVDLYAQNLGLAFQVRDDILDVIGDQGQLGKPIGSDARCEKTTFVTVLGLEVCKEWVQMLSDKACQALETLENSEFLLVMAKALSDRNS